MSKVLPGWCACTLQQSEASLSLVLAPACLGKTPWQSTSASLNPRTAKRGWRAEARGGPFHAIKSILARVRVLYAAHSVLIGPMSTSQFSVTIESVVLGLFFGAGLSRWLTRRADTLCDLLKTLLRAVPSVELLLGWCVKGSEILRGQSVGATVRPIVAGLSVTTNWHHRLMGGLTT